MTTSQKRAETIRLNKERAARMAANVAATIAVVDSGKCPLCGRGVHRNLALTGWWQCDGFGADGFRRDPSGPACEWQGFTR